MRGLGRRLELAAGSPAGRQIGSAPAATGWQADCCWRCRSSGASCFCPRSASRLQINRRPGRPAATATISPALLQMGLISFTPGVLFSSPTLQPDCARRDARFRLPRALCLLSSRLSPRRTWQQRAGERGGAGAPMYAAKWISVMSHVQMARMEALRARSPARARASRRFARSSATQGSGVEA